jgi:ketosteroid isomerase-like protein
MSDEARARAHRTIDRLQQALLAGDMNAFADEWAPHGTASFPFAPPGWPSPRGRDEVRAYLAGLSDSVEVRGIRHQTRHDTADPGTVVLEWGVTGTVRATGRPYDMDYVVVLTVGDAGIESFRDYWNPLAIADAMGGVGTMSAAFSESETQQ